MDSDEHIRKLVAASNGIEASIGLLDVIQREMADGPVDRSRFDDLRGLLLGALGDVDAPWLNEPQDGGAGRGGEVRADSA